MDMKKIHDYIDAHKEEYLDTLKHSAEIPSIAAQKDEVRRCAEFMKKRMGEMGIDAEIMETNGVPGNPVVFASIKSPNEGAPTMLIYGHYDVQPTGDEAEWKYPPFTPTEFEGRLYGRGVADNKGQHLAHLFGIEAWLKNEGNIPINIKIILDGEEEIGSPSLNEFVDSHRELLDCDFVLTSDGGMQTGNVPAVFFGARGVMNYEIIIQTAEIDNHSGNKGGVIRNAAWDLVQLLNKMVDEEGNVLIPGFYDEVVPMSDYDKVLIDKLPYEPEELKKDFTVKEITAKDKLDYYVRQMFKPTFTINGISSGWTGNGSKNIIPCKAKANMEVRFVWKMDPERTFNLIKDFVHRHYPDAEVNQVEANMNPSRSDSDNPHFAAVIEGVRAGAGMEPRILPVIAGSLPDYTWTGILKKPSVQVPFGNVDEANHSPRENYIIDLYYQGIHTSAEIIRALGEMQR